MASKPFLSPKEWALVGITMLWGATFLVVHIAMRSSGPLFFVGVRFLSAGLVALLLFRRSMMHVTRQELLAGAGIGLTIFLGYALQTEGLRTISSSASAFITALYVPLVPLLEWLFTRRAPKFMRWVGILFAFVGLILLAGPDAFKIGVGRGEMATLGCAVTFAGQIILIGHYAPLVDVRRVTVVQLLVGGIVAFAAMPFVHEPIPAFAWTWVIAGAGMGVASAFIQLVMNWAQADVSPTRATLIYAGEPVWGGVIGRIAGDRLPALALVGATLILLGVVVGEWRPRFLNKANSG